MSAGAKFFECGTGASVPCAFILAMMSSKEVVPIQKYGLRLVTPQVSHPQKLTTLTWLCLCVLMKVIAFLFFENK